MSREDRTTRHRILESAGKVFSERGYRDATIAEICRAADANIAAVNYHFGDKAALYDEVWRDAFQTAVTAFPADMTADASASAPDRLESLIRALLSRTLSPGAEGVFARLQVREMAEPTPALGAIVREALMPQRQILLDIVAELLGPKADAESIELCVYSVISQSLFVHMSEAFRRQLPEESILFGPSLETMVHHLTTFSLAGITACRCRLEDTHA